MAPFYVFLPLQMNMVSECVSLRDMGPRLFSMAAPGLTPAIVGWQALVDNLEAFLGGCHELVSLTVHD